VSRMYLDERKEKKKLNIHFSSSRRMRDTFLLSPTIYES
jgi:hypothetical protein